MNKLTKGLVAKLIRLLDESLDIYFEEHPFLNHATLPKRVLEVERRTQNTLELEKVLVALEYQFAIREPKGKQVILPY